MRRIKKTLLNIVRKVDTVIAKKLFFVVPYCSNEIVQLKFEKKYNFKNQEYKNFVVISNQEYKKDLLTEKHKYDFFSNQTYKKTYKLSGQGLVITRGGFVISDRKNVLLESCNHEEIYFWRYYFKIFLKWDLYFKTKKKIHHAFVFEHNLDYNYWHFHAEFLVSLGAVIKEHFENTSNILSVFIKSNYPESYREMILDLYGRYVNLVELKDCFFEAEAIYFNAKLYSKFLDSKNCEITERDVYFWQNNLNFFRGKFAKIQQSNQAITFVSRANATRRRLLNEAELLLFLKNSGIEAMRYQLENMSWLEQIELFNNSKIVFGIHGAHGANLLYSKPQVFVELVNLNRMKISAVMSQMDICKFRNIDHLIIDVSEPINAKGDYYLSTSDFKVISDEIFNLI